MASNNEGYWSRSWALLTRDQGWIKPLLVLSAARLVPIIGGFGADGYALEWARLTSWGVESSPKQRNVDVASCIKTGARAFVVVLGYGLAYLSLAWMLRGLFDNSGFLGMILGVVVGLAYEVIVTVAKLRATIYQSVGAGYQVERIYDMARRDYQGLLRIMGMNWLLGLLVSFLGGIIFFVIVMLSMGGTIGEIIAAQQYGFMDDAQVVGLIISWISRMMPMLTVAGYITGVFEAFSSLMHNTAVGLWMSQFDVRSWGASADPLPGDDGSAPAGGAAAPSQPAQQATSQASAYVDQQAFGIPEARDVPLQIDRQGTADEEIADEVATQNETPSVPQVVVPQVVESEPATSDAGESSSVETLVAEPQAIDSEVAVTVESTEDTPTEVVATAPEEPADPDPVTDEAAALASLNELDSALADEAAAYAAERMQQEQDGERDRG